MKQIYSIPSLLVYLTILVIIPVQGKDWYVSPTGSDDGDGSRSSPFLSIQRAVEVSRSSEVSKRIILDKGNYYQVQIVLTEADKGLTIEGSGEQVVLYGGKEIKNWQREGKYLIVDMPGTRNRDWDFRALIVNNELRPRARLPKIGKFRHKNEFDVRWLSSSAGGWERKPSEDELHNLYYETGDVPSTLDVKNAEITVYHEWDESLLALKKHDRDSETLVFDNTPGHPPGAFAKRNPNASKYIIWNIKEGMHEPGQWYLDRSNEKLYYWPKPGESKDNIHVVVPFNEHVIQLTEGTEDISLKNLTVSASTTPMITGGYAARHFGGAIDGVGNNISLEKVKVTNVTGWGIKIEGNHLSILNSEISNVGAGAVAYRGDHTVIDGCEIRDVGQIYESAVGIMGRGKQNTVSNNHILNMPYCGINNVGNNSLVEGNTIYNIKRVMQDGGAIYMIAHKNTVIRNNAIFGNPERNIPVYAYYLDERCDGCLVEGNFALQTQVPVQAHMTENCTYRNNLFIDDGLQSIRYALSFDLVFENNILLAEGIEFVGPTQDRNNHDIEETNEIMRKYLAANGMVPRRNNIIHSTSGQTEQIQLIQYNRVATSKLEGINNYLDLPKFTNPATGDLSLKNAASFSGTKVDAHKITNPLVLKYLEQLLPDWVSE